ncbi:MAG TPA: ABC transporter permease [Dehalococcoidia bacterium]|nr:ABC transporter permease [Dehalococcoidia bacterium]
MSATATTATPGPSTAPPHGESLTRRSLRRLLRKRLAVICIVAIGVFFFVGIFANFVAPESYSHQNLDLSFNGPSLHHPFGTDILGRDVFSRNVYAARTTVIVTAATVLSGFVLLPVTLGMLAGYRRGFADALIMRAGEILASLPGLPMLVLINVTLRPRWDRWMQHIANGIHWDGFINEGFADYFLIFGVLSLFGWVGGARIIRSQVLTLRNSEFITAARASGAGTPRILYQHILPNIMPLIIVSASAALGGIATAEIGLTFLGVGVQPPHPSFGSLISDGASRIVLQHHPEVLLVPAVIVAALIFSFNLLGDALNDVFTSRAA